MAKRKAGKKKNSPKGKGEIIQKTSAQDNSGNRKEKQTDEYYVKAIIGHKIMKDKANNGKKALHFLVDWENYVVNNWLPISSLDGCLDLVKEYIDNKRKEANQAKTVNNNINNQPLSPSRSPIKAIRIHHNKLINPSININIEKPKPFKEIFSIDYANEDHPKNIYNIKSIVFPPNENEPIKVTYQLNNSRITYNAKLDDLPLDIETKNHFLETIVKNKLDPGLYTTNEKIID